MGERKVTYLKIWTKRAQQKAINDGDIHIKCVFSDGSRRDLCAYPVLGLSNTERGAKLAMQHDVEHCASLSAPSFDDVAESGTWRVCMLCHEDFTELVEGGHVESSKLIYRQAGGARKI